MLRQLQHVRVFYQHVPLRHVGTVTFVAELSIIEVLSRIALSCDRFWPENLIATAERPPSGVRVPVLYSQFSTLAQTETQ